MNHLKQERRIAIKHILVLSKAVISVEALGGCSQQPRIQQENVLPKTRKERSIRNTSKILSSTSAPSPCEQSVMSTSAQPLPTSILRMCSCMVEVLTCHEQHIETFVDNRASGVSVLLLCLEPKADRKHQRRVFALRSERSIGTVPSMCVVSPDTKNMLRFCVFETA